MRCLSLTVLSLTIGAGLVVAAGCAERAGPRASPAAGAEPGRSAPRFEFHNHFWLNLHHFLYMRATERPDEPGDPANEADDAWAAAVAFYRENFASRDLMRDRELRRTDLLLAGVQTDEELRRAGLDERLVRVLLEAAPSYRLRDWPEHERSNAAWIARVAPLVERYLGVTAGELSAALRADWPPGTIRVDVLVYANRVGAYTTRGTPNHIRVGSRFPREESAAEAFETLLHEAAHLLLPPTGGPINERIAAECRRRGIDVPRDLWHAIIFYTAGHVVRRSPAAPPDYVPYAERRGLYERAAWRGYRAALESHWRAYLEGRADLEGAIAGMIERLSAEAAPETPGSAPPIERRGAGAESDSGTGPTGSASVRPRG